MGKKIQYIGRYVMDGVTLGKGNFARVELATHGVTQLKVAIKVIDTSKIKEKYVRANMHREARIMAGLRHPNVIRLYETLKATTLYCLVTEYACGGELLAYIKQQENQRLTESHARKFIRQLISALQFLHEKGVVHRDLKMENIMLDEKKKHVKLIDFGLSNVWRQDQPLETHCGSPEYAAPELFLVGKTYGPEIDIWSLGIITYAMIVGSLPFTTPFKDEYQRQRMLQSIQKGLSAWHERQMRAAEISSDLRNLLHQLIEPNPELRIPLSEVMIHPWITRNGKYPFATYVPPPRDKTLRHQTVAELAFMMSLKRKEVEETVRENKADELSAMYNMIVDEKRKKQGFFDIDHTHRKLTRRERESRSRSRERDKLRTPESTRAAAINKGKAAVGAKKVPNKSTLGKSGAGSKAKPKNRQVSTSTAGTNESPPTAPVRTKPLPGPITVEKLMGERAKAVIDAEMVPERASSSPAPQRSKAALGVPAHPHHNTSALAKAASGTAKLAAGTAKVEPKEKPAATANGPTRIPLSQRRQPPAKLNLTLDLSVTNSWPTPKRPLPPMCTSEGLPNESGERRSDPSLGIAASSGVPPRLSPPKDKEEKDSKSKIPVLSPSKGKDCKSSPSKLANRPSSLPCKGGTEAEEEPVLLAPKATPEDSLIDSYSTSSEEDGPRSRLLSDSVELKPQVDLSMQPALLNASDDEKLRQAGLSPYEPGAPGGEDVHREDQALLEKACDPRRLIDTKRYLLRHFGESVDQYESSGSAVSHTLSSHSGTALAGSGSSLPAKFPASAPLSHAASGCPRSSTCLGPAPGGTGTETRLVDSAASSGSIPGTRAPLTLTLSHPGRLAPNPPECHKCGLSPGSPTYYDRHNKFCHTGAHALDVFVSPDEVPSPTGPLWRPVASAVHDSPTGTDSPAHRDSPIFKFPRMGLGRPKRKAMQTSFVQSESFSDDDFEDDRSMLPSSGMSPLLPGGKTSRGSSNPVPLLRSVGLPRALTGSAQSGKTPHISAESKSSAGDGKQPSSGSTTQANGTGNGSAGHSAEVRTAAAASSTKSVNVRSRTKTQRQTTSNNGAVYTQLPDSTSRLETSGAGSSSTLSGGEESDEPHGSTEKLATTGNKAKVHPAKGSEKDKDTSSSVKSRIPRPSGKLSKIQVFGLLQKEKKEKEPISSEKNSSDSPQSSPATEKKKGKKKLLKQYDSKTKQMSWKKGLSHLLRISRSNSNNNIVPKNKSPTTLAKSNNSSTKVSANSTAIPSGNPVVTVTTDTPIGKTGNSIGNQCVIVPDNGDTRRNSVKVISTETIYKELDAKWTAPPTPTLKCNSLQVTSVPVPSSCPAQAAPVYEVNSSAPPSPRPSISGPAPSGHAHPGNASSISAANPQLSHCKQCAKSDRESSDDGDVGCSLEVNTMISSGLMPNSNNMKGITQMASKV